MRNITYLAFPVFEKKIFGHLPNFLHCGQTFYIVAPNDPSPIILTNLNPRTLLIICTKFGQNLTKQFRRRSRKCKSLRTDGRTDDGRRTVGDTKSSP